MSRVASSTELWGGALERLRSKFDLAKKRKKHPEKDQNAHYGRGPRRSHGEAYANGVHGPGRVLAAWRCPMHEKGEDDQRQKNGRVGAN